MPELRRDPVVGYWTIMATERSRRPVEFKNKRILDERPCPFCESCESQTTGEVFAIRKTGTLPNTPGWQVRVVNSKSPILCDDPKAGARYGEGLYDLMDGFGRHELVIETPHHRLDLDELALDDVQKAVEAYVQRFNVLEQDDRLKYPLLFKNHGLVSGSARDVIRHARSQIIATPITPKRVKEELTAAKNYYERRDRCVYCDILKQETNEGLRAVFENKAFYAFCPFASRSPFEMWILPKGHGADFGKISVPDQRQFAAALKVCLAKLRALLDDPPFNFVMHTAPFRHGKKSSYWRTLEEDTHWYLQITPRLTPDAGFEWGTGTHINPTPPEDAAVLLRDTRVGAEQDV